MSAPRWDARTRVERTVAVAALATVAATAACRGGERNDQLPAVAASAPEAAVLRTSGLHAGGPVADIAVVNPYASDPVALADGRKLYGAMNCGGCHGPSGGGGIGPPFADQEWIYGGEPENIVASILRGRPNGMPSFGARLPESEAWKIAAFVHSLAGTGGGQQPSVGEGQGPRSKGESGVRRGGR